MCPKVPRPQGDLRSAAGQHRDAGRLPGHLVPHGAAIAALLVAAVVLAVKVAFYRGQVARNRRDSEVRRPASSGPLPVVTGGTPAG